ncbi:putative oxidoreductase C-terminal domain-containing protein [Lewinella sp. IMCC34191]|uniref:putative oxidoreductase C-terminal domain-containing protein n=1 Tax=Lewinella sp. IMCC34191 TaxID=2259172 RepID=UPI000E26825C|nr:putative oxidoreductase C-terminal domain-containing protein [Lewinella sp. IMCC34191]
MKLVLALCLFGGLLSCAGGNQTSDMMTTSSPGDREDAEPVRLITLDPGHFHAALVQKSMYPQVDSTVHVYAPEGSDVDLHLERIERYNQADNPTAWEEVVYRGPDFFERMLAEKPGNVVVLSGNNGRKTEYIAEAVENGLNVLADKPMVIEPAEYELLRRTMAEAEERDLLLYDIMTERYEITTMLQQAFSRQENVFGKLVDGTVDEPAISKESVHHFSKEVSGAPLIRPDWFFDVRQQGEGIVDVATHLVDLILWETFPGEPIDTNEVEVLDARRWSTDLIREQFSKVTGLKDFPESLQGDVSNGALQVYANGEIDFRVRNVHAKASVTWNFEAPPGAADTHYSMMRGSLADLVIRQDADQQYIPTLYIEPKGAPNDAAIEQALMEMQVVFPGIDYRVTDDGYEITVPDRLRSGHEAHFGQVMRQFLTYLESGDVPEWERTNMLTKYYITTRAYRMSR